MENKYKIIINQIIDGTTTKLEVPTSGTIIEVCEPNNIWDNSTCYCGTSIESVTQYSIINFGEDYSSCEFSGNFISNVNLRFMCAWFSSNANPINRIAYRWTGLNESAFDYYSVNNANSYQLFNPLLNRNENLTTNNVYSHWWMSFINELKINDLIVVPYFTIKTIKFSGRNSYDSTNDSAAYYSNINITEEILKWVDIKNQDKTNAGSKYDEDLWNNGWKLINSDSDSVTYKYCSGVTLIPYYGKSSKIYNDINDTYDNEDGVQYGVRTIFGSLISDTYPTINNQNRNIPHLFVAIEGYNNDLNSVTYSTIPGISWATVTNINKDNGDVSQWSFNTENYHYLNSTFFNNVNLDIANTLRGGIISEFSLVDETGTIVIPPHNKMSGNFDFNSEIWGTSNSNNVLYHPLLSEDNNTVYITLRKNIKQVTVAGYAYSIFELWKKIACIAVYVADDVVAATNAKLGIEIGNNNHIYIGKMDDNGVTTGIMIQGSDIKNTIQANIDDIIHDTPYEPINPLDGDLIDPDRDEIKPPNREGDNIVLNLNNRFGAFDGFLTLYNLTENELGNFGSALMGNPLEYRGNFEKDLSDELSGTYDVSSLLNYIVSVKMYPFSVATLENTSIQATSNIYIGTGDFGVPIGTQCRKLTSSISVLNAGSLYVAPLTPYMDFRDYYNTTVVCYMPYCGSVELNPMDIMNTTLRCYYLIDFLTGECTSILYSIGSNNLNYPVAIANGNIGIDIPLSATNSGQLSAIKKMQNAQTAHTIISFINSGLNIGNDISTLATSDSINAFYPNGKLFSTREKVNAANDIVRNIGSIADSAFSNYANPYGANRSARSAVATPLMPTGSGATNFMLNDSVYLQIRRGTYSRPNNYASTMAYPNTFSSKLSNVKGLTYCANVNINGINCTQEEKNLIKNALESGTIL